MKNALLLLFFACASLPGTAQALRYKVHAGGAAHYSSFNTVSTSAGLTTQDATTSKLLLQPSIGFFLKDRLAVGLQASYQQDTQSATWKDNTQNWDNTPVLRITEGQTHSSSWSAGPFARYYWPLTERILLFAHAGTGIGDTEQENTSTTYAMSSNQGSTSEQLTSKSSSTNSRPLLFANLKPGIIFFPIAKVGFEVSIGELGYYNYGEGIKQKYIANLGLSSLQIGASLLLGK